MRLINQRNATKGLLIVLAGLIIFWGMFFRTVQAAHVTVSWSYDYDLTPACSATRITECIDYFEIMDITDQRKTVVPSVGNPKAAVGKVDGISADFNYGPPFGWRTISVIAVGRDRNGLRVNSDPHAARVTVFIRPFLRLPAGSRKSEP